MILDIILYLLLIISIYFLFYVLFLGWKRKSIEISKKIKKTYVNIRDINKIEKSLEEKIFKTTRMQEHKRKINEITEREEGIIGKLKNKVIDAVTNKYHNFGFFYYYIFAVAFIFLGYSVGWFVLHNFGITVVLSAVGATVPYLFLEYRIKYVEREKDKKLLIVMGNLAASYLFNDTFEDAVEDNLSSIPKPLYKPFSQYFYEVKYYTPERKEYALLKLASEVNNFYFYEFIQMVIQAEQGETGLKYTIRTIPVDYQSYLEKNIEYEKTVSEYNLNFLIRILLLPGVIGFVKILDKSYYKILTENIFGKTLLFLAVIVYLVSAVLFRKYNKEIKLEL